MQLLEGMTSVWTKMEKSPRNTHIYDEWRNDMYYMIYIKKKISSVWKDTHQIIKSDHLWKIEARGDVKGNSTIFAVCLDLHYFWN